MAVSILAIQGRTTPYSRTCTLERIDHHRSRQQHPHTLASKLDHLTTSVYFLVYLVQKMCFAEMWLLYTQPPSVRAGTLGLNRQLTGSQSIFFPSSTTINTSLLSTIYLVLICLFTCCTSIWSTFLASVMQFACFWRNPD